MDVKKTLKVLEPYFAAAIFIMILACAIFFYQYNNIQEDISENCGWEKYDYRCICEQSEVIAMENELAEKYGENWNDYLDR